jgi:stage II sporulation protein AA (anti-sigma F factor antagonist)
MEVKDDFKVIDGYLCIRLPQEVDHHRAAYICENADRYIVKEQVSNVVFDFEDTRFMDSSGIGIIMGRYKKISCFGGKVFAIHADKQIKRLLYLSGLSKIIEMME